ncbi:MAG: S8 family serine peptidase, partial [Syntrophales bacterium]
LVVCLSLIFFTCGEVFADSHIVIANQEDSLPPGLAAKITEAGGTVTATISQIGVAVAESDDPDFTAKLSAIAGVRSVIPNIRFGQSDPVVTEPLNTGMTMNLMETVAADLDELSFLQWNLLAIDAPGAWESGQTGVGVRVAVLDTGIVTTHPDLAPNLNLALSKSFVPSEPTVDFIYPNMIDYPFSHASHVAGIIAGADNNIGIVGVAPDAEIVAVKVISDNLGDGEFSWVLQGIVYAADIKADVINLSLGEGISRHGEPGFPAKMVQELVTALNRAASYAHKRGATIVAAVGNGAVDRNHDKDVIFLPADLPHVISVSATGPIGLGLNPDADLDSPAFYSDFGQSAVDLAAPGGNLDFDLYYSGDICPPGIPCFMLDFVLSAGFDPTAPDQAGWEFSIGTSMAAPHVAGTAALIIGRNGGDMQPDQVRTILQQTADDLGKPGNDPFYGHGRVNAGNAVR